MSVDIQSGCQSLVTARHRARIARPRPIGCGREYEKRVAELRSEQRKCLLAFSAMRLEQGDSRRVDRHPAHLVSLRVLLRAGNVIAADFYLARLDIHMSPPERTQLAASSTGHDGQPDVQTPFSTLQSRCLDDARGLGRGRRMRLRSPFGRLSNSLGRIERQPPPAHGRGRGAGQHGVDLTDRRSGQRPADMRAAA